MAPMGDVPYAAFGEDSVRTGHDALGSDFRVKKGYLATKSGSLQRDFLGKSPTCGGSTPLDEIGDAEPEHDRDE